MINYTNEKDEKAFVELRPVLFFDPEIESNDIENFQNETLRPVVKLQHNLLIDILLNQANIAVLLEIKSKRSEFHNRLKLFLQQPQLKGIFLGTIIGHFTQSELKTYFKHQKEFNKRIIQMLIERLTDSIA